MTIQPNVDMRMRFEYGGAGSFGLGCREQTMTASGDPIIDALPPPARALLAQAFGFYFTAQYATEHADNCESVPYDVTPAVLVNIGFAYELSFKAVLAAHGWDDQRLQRELGHDLIAAMQQAQDYGLQLTPTVCKNIQLLSPHFKRPTLRYLNYGTIELPGKPLLVLSIHMQAVRDLLLVG